MIEVSDDISPLVHADIKIAIDSYLNLIHKKYLWVEGKVLCCCYMPLGELVEIQ
jgi:hypothetical protein